MRSFFLPNWSPPDDPARPLPAEGRPWPSDDDDDVDNDDADDIGDRKEPSVFWTRSGSRTTLRFCCKRMKKREILVSLLMSKNNPILFSLMEEILSDGRFSIFFK